MYIPKLQGGNFCKKVKIAKLSITAFFVSRAELLSRSVDAAIDVQISDFENSEATVRFLHHANDIFDIFNSRHFNNSGCKKLLCLSNKTEVFTKVDEICEYFGSMKCEDSRLIINTQG